MSDFARSPTLAEETERLRKWRETRRRAAEDPAIARQQQAALSREQRLALFEQDKAKRIRDAETRRRNEAQALESRRMEKARAHLDALDDIETAKANLLVARSRSRRRTLLAFFAAVVMPTLATAAYFLMIAPPVYQSTSILTLASGTPEAAQNPLLNDGNPLQPSSMAPAFRMRAALYAASPRPRAFEVAINAREGLLTLRTRANTPEGAALLNAEMIAGFDLPVTLVAPPSSAEKMPRALRMTILAFLSSLSIFTLGAVFLKSLLHHSRT